MSLGAPARADVTLRYAPSYRFLRSMVLRADGLGFETESQALAQRVTFGLRQTLHAHAHLERRRPPRLGPELGARPGRRLGHLRQPAMDAQHAARAAAGDFSDRRLLRPARRVGRVVRVGRDALLPGAHQRYLLDLAPLEPRRASPAVSERHTGGHPRSRQGRGGPYLALRLARLDYDALEDWDLRYGYLIAQRVDRIKDTDALTQAHSARVAWGEDYFDGRLFTSASYSAGYTSSRLVAGPTGATRETQQRPSTGLSKVEVFPDEPARVTLDRNPALADADTATPTALDLGHGRSTARDVAPRDLGAEFPDDRLEVNVIRVWVDRSSRPRSWRASPGRRGRATTTGSGRACRSPAPSASGSSRTASRSPSIGPARVISRW